MRSARSSSKGRKRKQSGLLLGHTTWLRKVRQKGMRFANTHCSGVLKVWVLFVCLLCSLCIAELNKLIRRIMRRIEKVPQRGSIKPKKRIQASPSSTRPPPSYPEWAVREEFRQQFNLSPQPENPASHLSFDSSDSDFWKCVVYKERQAGYIHNTRSPSSVRKRS